MKKLIFTMVTGIMGLNLNAGIICETNAALTDGIKTVIVYSNNYPVGESMTITKGNVKKKLLNVTYDEGRPGIRFGGSEGIDVTFPSTHHGVIIQGFDFRRDGVAKGTYVVTDGLEFVSKERVRCEFTYDLF